MVVRCECIPYTNPTPTLHPPYTHLVRRDDILGLRRHLQTRKGWVVQMMVSMVVGSARNGARCVWGGVARRGTNLVRLLLRGLLKVGVLCQGSHGVVRRGVLCTAVQAADSKTPCSASNVFGPIMHDQPGTVKGVSPLKIR